MTYYSISGILKMWRDLVEVYSPDDNLNNFFSELRDYDNQISLALELDDTNLTAILILDNVLKQYLENKSINLSEIAGSRSNVLKFLVEYQNLNDALHAPEIESLVKDFQDGIATSLNNVQCLTPSVAELISNRFMLAEIRLAALKSNRDLKVFKFSSGNNDATDFVFFKEVRQYFDVNILLQLAANPHFPNSISLHLIRDVVNEEFSYFVFLIKNGDNVYLVADNPDLPSPDYKNRGRSRSISRKFSARIDAHYFPYSFMNVEFNKKTALYEIKNFYSTDLVPADQSNIVGRLNEMDAESIVWVYMLFWLFKQKFFADEPIQLEQSYTGAMIRTGIESPKVSNAIIKAYPALNVQSLTTSLLTNSNPEIVKQWKYEPTHQNQWMEDRYADKIKNTDRILNYVEVPALPDDYNVKTGNIIQHHKKDTDSFFGQDKLEVAIPLRGVSVTDMGSAQTLEQNRIFFARLSQARSIQVLAQQEFNATRKSVFAWYFSQVVQNISELKRAIATETFMCNVSVHNSYSPDRPSMADSFDSHMELRNIFVLLPIEKRRGWYDDEQVVLLGGGDRFRQCYFTNGQASYVAKFYVRDSDSIARVCNLSVSDLPDVLQHVRGVDRYIGNSILSRIDPLDNLKNPWNKLDYSIEIALSKRALNAIRKEYGIKKENQS